MRKQSLHLMLFSMVLILIIGGISSIYVFSMANFFHEWQLNTQLQFAQKIYQQISIPVPSAVLLFSMGLLGIICVNIDEKRQKPPLHHT